MLLGELDTGQLVAIVGAILGGVATLIGAVFKGIKVVLSRMPDPATIPTLDQVSEIVKTQGPFTREQSRIDRQLEESARQIGKNAKHISELQVGQARIEEKVGHNRELLERTHNNVERALGLLKNGGK